MALYSKEESTELTSSTHKKLLATVTATETPRVLRLYTPTELANPTHKTYLLQKPPQQHLEW